MNLSNIHDLVLTYAPEQLPGMIKTLKDLTKELEQTQTTFVRAIVEAQTSRDFDRAHELLEAEANLLHELDEIKDTLSWDEHDDCVERDLALDAAIEYLQRTPLDTPLEEIGMPLKAYHMLARRGVRTLRELVALTEAELLQFRNIGPACLKQIKECVAKCGWSLAEKK